MLKLEIVQDEDPQSPRVEMDNLGTIVCFHRKYKLGDKTDLPSTAFDGWADMKAHLIEQLEAEVVLPLYLLDHSGLSLSTSDFNDKWDSGQVGFIYATRAAILSQYFRKRITDRLRARVKLALQAEVAVYAQYLEGDVWGFMVKDEDGEVVDSCWGFYGRQEAEEGGVISLRYEENRRKRQKGE
jgi:hypothetical protein